MIDGRGECQTDSMLLRSSAALVMLEPERAAEEDDRDYPTA